LDAAMTDVRVAGLVPTFDNPATVRGVVERLRASLTDVLVVDDGSGPAGHTACLQLQEEGLAMVCRLPRNRGKGAAVKRGLAFLHERGFTHALQVDADGQHDIGAAPKFLHAAATDPDALVLGYPVYDASVSKVRLRMRKLTEFWVDLEVGAKGRIRDAMIGFRIYPLTSTLRVGARGNRMDYDVEIAVRMARAGVPIVNLPVAVRYLRSDEGGISHFQPLRDNLRLSWLHCRICTAISLQATFGWLAPRRA
jgi:glycosyltransferase involved in cell wall biosynthesis